MEGFEYKKGMVRSADYLGKRFYNIDDSINKYGYFKIEDAMAVYGENILWEIREAIEIYINRYVQMEVPHLMIDEDFTEVLFAINIKRPVPLKVSELICIPRKYPTLS